MKRMPVRTSIGRRTRLVLILAALSLLGSLALFPAPATAIYTCEIDLPGSSANHACKYHWHNHEMGWHYGSSLAQPKETSVFQAAVHWNDTNSEFHFEFNLAVANHVGEHSISCPGCLIVAETHDTNYTNGSPYHLLEQDMHFNSDLNNQWNNDPNSCPNGENYDTEGIATHEWGHALGLDHPEQAGDPLKTMEPGHYPKCWARSLEKSDKDGQRAVYDESPGD